MKNSSKLERFNNTLNDLEGELVKLRNTSKAYLKLQELSSSYQLIIDQFKQNDSALQDLTTKQVAEHLEIKKSLDEIGKSLTLSLEELRKENRQFYFDFEKVVRIKLEEHKAEIKQLIENERLIIKETINDKIDKESNTFIQNQKKVNNMILFFGIISILLLIGILAKQFM